MGVSRIVWTGRCSPDAGARCLLSVQVGINAWRALKDIHIPHAAWAHLKGKPLEGKCMCVCVCVVLCVKCVCGVHYLYLPLCYIYVTCYRMFHVVHVCFGMYMLHQCYRYVTWSVWVAVLRPTCMPIYTACVQDLRVPTAACECRP